MNNVSFMESHRIINERWKWKLKYRKNINSIGNLHSESGRLLEVLWPADNVSLYNLMDIRVKEVIICYSSFVLQYVWNTGSSRSVAMLKSRNSCTVLNRIEMKVSSAAVQNKECQPIAQREPHFRGMIICDHLDTSLNAFVNEWSPRTCVETPWWLLWLGWRAIFRIYHKPIKTIIAALVIRILPQFCLLILKEISH